MKYIVGRGYTSESNATIPAYSRRPSATSQMANGFGPDVYIPEVGIVSDILAQRQILNDHDYRLFRNPNGVGNNSKHSSHGEFCYVTESPTGIYARYTGEATTGLLT